MVGTLNQPSRVQDEGPLGCKLLLPGKKRVDLSAPDGTWGISTG
jgi:hypothetical protein